MANSESDRWVGIIVRFFFGAILGALSGIALWGYFLPDAKIGWLAIPVAACTFGVLSAIWGDKFWTEGITWIGGCW